MVVVVIRRVRERDVQVASTKAERSVDIGRERANIELHTSGGLLETTAAVQKDRQRRDCFVVAGEQTILFLSF